MTKWGLLIKHITVLRRTISPPIWTVAVGFCSSLQRHMLQGSGWAAVARPLRIARRSTVQLETGFWPHPFCHFLLWPALPSLYCPLLKCSSTASQPARLGAGPTSWYLGLFPSVVECSHLHRNDTYILADTCNEISFELIRNKNKRPGSS